MNKSLLFIFVFIYSLGNAQNFSNSNSIIPAPNFYKATGDSIQLNGRIKVIFEKQYIQYQRTKNSHYF
ncbi:hypothetical protein J2W48_001617 [Flavobacterium piscis]|uniref:Uncharacterized protein n=1 Tax=Flavobacterium piscis TaxID=1114874 RepID=A0ABU1Y622_9FLAO|nr:hypothetical protein [Flavobacterium piscis]